MLPNYINPYSKVIELEKQNRALRKALEKVQKGLSAIEEELVFKYCDIPLPTMLILVEDLGKVIAMAHLTKVMGPLGKKK